MLSKFDRNARMAFGHEVRPEWDGKRCRVLNAAMNDEIERRLNEPVPDDED